MNIGGPPVFGIERWGAGSASYSQPFHYNASRPSKDQALDIDMAVKKIICPELNGLVRNMDQSGDIWIGGDMPSPVLGEFFEVEGDPYDPEKHKGTIYINGTYFWDYNGFGYVLKRDHLKLAEVLAHEAAHAWFGYPNTISGDQEQAVTALAQSCIR